MADTIYPLICSQCGAPLNVKLCICDYCGTHFSASPSRSPDYIDVKEFGGKSYRIYTDADYVWPTGAVIDTYGGQQDSWSASPSLSPSVSISPSASVSPSIWPRYDTPDFTPDNKEVIHSWSIANASFNFLSKLLGK